MSNNSLTARQRAAVAAANPQRRTAMRNGFLAQNKNLSPVVSYGTLPRRRDAGLAPLTRRVPNQNRNNSASIPRTIASTAITATFTHVTTMIAPQFTGTNNVTAPTHTSYMAMRPSRHGLSSYCNLYMQYRFIKLEYRFVGILPDNTAGHIFTGYSPTNASFANNGAHVSALSGFWSGRCNTSSPWKTVVSPQNTQVYYLNNDYNTQAATNANAQGWLHSSISGVPHNTQVGYFELRGIYEFHGPCMRTAQE